MGKLWGGWFGFGCGACYKGDCHEVCEDPCACDQWVGHGYGHGYGGYSHGGFRGGSSYPPANGEYIDAPRPSGPAPSNEEVIPSEETTDGAPMARPRGSSTRRVSPGSVRSRRIVPRGSGRISPRSGRPIYRGRRPTTSYRSPSPIESADRDTAADDEHATASRPVSRDTSVR